MLASAPPPLPHRPTRLATPLCAPPLVKTNPLALGKKSTSKKKKEKKKGLQKEKKDPLIRHCNEATFLICLGIIFFLKLAPTSWAGAPLQGLRPRAMAPPCPPPGTPLIIRGIIYKATFLSSESEQSPDTSPKRFRKLRITYHVACSVYHIPCFMYHMFCLQCSLYVNTAGGPSPWVRFRFIGA